MKLDPLELVRTFSGPQNREIAGLTASSLAYGKVEIIRENLHRLFTLTGKDLVDFSCGTSFHYKMKRLSGFKHRFNSGLDMALLFECVGKAYEEKGSLEAVFCEELQGNVRNIKHALNEFSKTMQAWARTIVGKGKSDQASFEYLFPIPERGSACKRLNMYLRWMVRKPDGIDLGIWGAISPSQLVMPVDTHVAALALRLGLTGRKTADWRMAEEITDRMKKISPSDPVKYDFSLCRCGMIEFRNSREKFSL